MNTIRFEITGETPLLLNRFHEAAQEESTRGIHARHADWPEPMVDAASRLYLLPSNGKGEGDRPYFPGENLRQAVIIAAARQRIGRRAATADMAGALAIEPAALELVGTGSNPGGWELDSRAVVVPATRGRVLRHRPLFPAGWRIRGNALYDERLVDERLVHTCFEQAGQFVGIGDFRPARKGPYGRYRVTSWQAD